MNRAIRLGPLPARIEVKPRDCWIGASWKVTANLVDVWVCLIPMLPVHFWFLRRWKGDPTFFGAGTRIYELHSGRPRTAPTNGDPMDEDDPPTTEELENAGERYLDEQRDPPDYEEEYLQVRGEMTPPPHEWPGGGEAQDAADEVPTP